MKKDILDTFMSREAINSGFLEVFYTFSSGVGDVVWNDLYTTGEHYCNSKLLADRYPGLSIGLTDTPSTLISGSGYFTRNDMLRVGSGIGHEEWTIFMDFGDENCSNERQIENVPEILVSSMSTPDSPSGFNVGINNANKLFIEYDNLGEKSIHTLDSELSTFNVISLSYSKDFNEFDLAYHDFPNGVNKNLVFEAENYIHGDVWHLGGMHDPSNMYTGYSGYLDDFLFFGRSISSASRDNLSEAFFVDEVIPSSTVLSSGYQDLPVGVSVNPTGVIGTGVTGYDCAPFITVEQKVGDDIDLYALSGVSGELTGSVVEFDMSGSGWVPFSVFNPEYSIYNTGELLKHSKTNLCFVDAPSSEDIYEFYLFQKPKPNLNKEIYFSSSRSAALSSDYSPGNNINLYVNGVSQVSGSNYEIEESNILSTTYSVEDFVSFDRIEGETFVSGFGGASSDYEINNLSLHGEDIFLNGQKLISGLDYETEGETTGAAKITLFAPLPDGELSFMAKAENITSIVTGNSSEVVQTSSVDELIWLNGVKQKENYDYFRVNECTLSDPCKNIRKQSSFIYNNSEQFFNI